MRGVTWRILGLGLGLGLGGLACSLNASGLGDEGPSPGDDTTNDTTASSGTTVVGDTTTSASTSASTTDSTSEATTADSSTSDTTGPETPALVDTGLLARWYVDEASAGSDVTHVLDSVEPHVDLEIIYAGGTPEYAELDGSRGLVWSNAGRSGRPLAPIVGTKIFDELGGATQVTIELVVAVKDVASETSRLFHVGTGGSGGDFVIGSSVTNRLEVRWNGASTRDFEASFTGDRQVLHLVVDTTQPGDQDRLRAYLDEVELVSLDMDGPGLDEGLPLQDTSSLVLGNRSDGQRSFRGTLGYAAIYLGALTPEDIAHNAEVLLLSDDTP